MDGLEADLAGQVEVIRIDMLSELGRNTAGLYGVQAVPTMLIFDGAGQLVYRSSGIPDRGKLREVALGLLATP